MKLKESATQREVHNNYNRLENFYRMDEYWKEDIHKEKRILLYEAYQVLSEM